LGRKNLKENQKQNGEEKKGRLVGGVMPQRERKIQGYGSDRPTKKRKRLERGKELRHDLIKLALGR